ncbi:MAG: hypothetical protein KC486_36630 [Myxococcales bacterium]|nr:hypothetical protein [Myxococcales bacterium]
MSLVIDLFDPAAGDYAYLNAVDVDAAGFESYRRAVWGSEALRRRGLRLLPRLRERDLFVYPHELDAFAAECAAIRGDAEAIAAELGDAAFAERLREYTARFLGVVALARERGAGVCIS